MLGKSRSGDRWLRTADSGTGTRAPGSLRMTARGLFMLKRCVFVIGAMLLAHPVLAQPAAPARAAAAIPTVEDRVSGLKKIDGYFPLYWEERTGSMLLEIPRFDAEFLFSTGLSAGLGSNDIGLDRGQGGQGRIVTFQRVGPRVMLVQGNQSFRSSSRERARAQVRRGLVRQVGALGLHRGGRVRASACWWTPPTSSCATCTARAAACGPAPTASTARAVRSTCPTRRASRRTPRST